MPIDDILGKMEGGKVKNKQKSARTHYDMANLISSHIDRVNGLSNDIKIDKNQILHFKKWIKFTLGCKLDFIPIPRKEMLELLSKQDADFKELLGISDIRKYIDDPVVITSSQAYNKISMFTGISKIIEFEQIKEFSNTGARTTIHDLKYLSLFIREGEKLRKYSQETGNAPEYKILELLECHSMEFHAEFKPFDSKSLISFCKKTGITDIQEMVKETVELLEYFRQNHNSKGDLQYHITEIRKDLFNRLSKYHPEMVYGYRETFDGEDLPADLPEPPEDEGDWVLPEDKEPPKDGKLEEEIKPPDEDTFEEVPEPPVDDGHFAEPSGPPDEYYPAEQLPPKYEEPRKPLGDNRDDDEIFR